MASPPLAPWRSAVFTLVALVAFSGSAATGNSAALNAGSSTGQAAGGSAPANVYPDWAAAIAPAYTSRVTGKGRTTDQFYDTYTIDTADSYATVLAWYKAHVQTTWPTRHPDQTVGKVGDVHITLQSPDGKGTTIGLIKKR